MLEFFLVKRVVSVIFSHDLVNLYKTDNRKDGKWRGGGKAKRYTVTVRGKRR